MPRKRFRSILLLHGRRLPAAAAGLLFAVLLPACRDETRATAPRPLAAASSFPDSLAPEDEGLPSPTTPPPSPSEIDSLLAEAPLGGEPTGDPPPPPPPPEPETTTEPEPEPYGIPPRGDLTVDLYGVFGRVHAWTQSYSGTTVPYVGVFVSVTAWRPNPNPERALPVSFVEEKFDRVLKPRFAGIDKVWNEEDGVDCWTRDVWIDASARPDGRGRRGCNVSASRRPLPLARIVVHDRSDQTRRVFVLRFGITPEGRQALAQDPSADLPDDDEPPRAA